MSKDDMETECMNELFGVNKKPNIEENDDEMIHWRPVSIYSEGHDPSYDMENKDDEKTKQQKVIPSLFNKSHTME